MNKLTLGLCQTNVTYNKENNLKEAEKFLEKSYENNVEIGILPEMFNCPYENEKFVEFCESEDNSPTLNMLSDKAKEYSMYIIGGSIPEKDDDKIYNTSFVYNDKGKLIAKHRKMHLFDIDVKDGVSFKESDTLSAGNEFTIFKTPKAKIGLGICYDVRFVELSRILTLENVDILVFPGAFNQTTGPRHWETLFKSRALDNQVYSIGVAPALNKNSEYHSYGHSIICNPWGEIVREAEYNHELIIETIDLDLISKVREEIPVLKNRRTDLYSIKKRDRRLEKE